MQTSLERVALLRGMQRRHRKHHSSGRTSGGRCNCQCNYAITSPLYDLCFGTFNNEANDA